MTSTGNSVGMEAREAGRNAPKPLPPEALERLARRSEYEANTGCLLWSGTVTSRGYGHLRIGGRLVSAHRASYEANNGPIRPGLVVMHKCDTPQCINPDHLTLGDSRANMQDMVQRGRRKASWAGYQRISDQERGFIASSLDRPVREVARHLGRDRATVRRARSALTQPSAMENGE